MRALVESIVRRNSAGAAGRSLRGVADAKKAQAIVIGLAERIVFVVVALTARHGEPKECGGGGVRQVGLNFRLQPRFFLKDGRSAVPLAQPQEACGDQSIHVGRGLWCCSRQLVPGQLFADKLTERLIGIE